MQGKHHGEYKVPGGKLVVVDLDVTGGALRDVHVAGDFFLEPDEALGAIDAALEGAPADTDARGLAARIDAALPPGAVLFGFTSEAVGIAVRRAVAQPPTGRTSTGRSSTRRPNRPRCTWRWTRY